jgi:hypothetical protein
MEAEHCSRGGSHVRFVTGNYHINTFPAQEWAITVHFDLSDADVRHNRRLATIAEHMENDIVKLARLVKCEVIAVVLYTGPMVSNDLEPFLCIQ